MASDTMSLTIESASAMQQTAIGEKIAIAVMREQLANQREMGAALVDLIEVSGGAGGGKIDLFA